MVVAVKKPVEEDFEGLKIVDLDPVRHIKVEGADQGHIDWLDYARFLELEDIHRILYYIEVFEDIADVAGDIVELGVFRGRNLKFMSLASQVVEPQGNRNVVGFDTFEGFPQKQLVLPQEKTSTVSKIVKSNSLFRFV